jgi:mannose-6-phosphate isomerase-like protein (cupin superfamily)
MSPTENPVKPLDPESLARFRAGLTAPWQPIEVARVNDSVVRMALLHGSFEWHAHEEDEMFLGYEGEFDLETEQGTVRIRPNEFHVVPAGTRHRPIAAEPAVTLLFERIETRQYGDLERP